MKKLLLSAILVFGLVTNANAESGKTHIEDFDFSFEGPFGKFDQYQLQRGLQVYTQKFVLHAMGYVRLHSEL